MYLFYCSYDLIFKRSLSEWCGRYGALVRPLWCGHYGVYNLVWGLYGAGFLWRATVWCNGAKIFFALCNFWWPLKGPFFKLSVSYATNYYMYTQNLETIPCT